ncbi:hypothetical protein DOTSEDRAFT_69697 [Dothistroma septosporum NZE10]|uniref:Uncharacterized protein n=1 Tax=Dothistroma septosporum (strain NZE10 / CBS 128990) TaxID=675120 RepID=N1PZN2_DOTSN|nr:hypothetical protein DOTSEDRAFT_69697 [Dothistroma septosporum NZE10]
MNQPPRAPMPPASGFLAHNDPLIRFDVGGLSDDDPFSRGSDRINNGAKKANKNDKNKQYVPIEVDYEGFMLEKLVARPGEKSSWARVGRRPLPFSNEKFADISRKVREDTRTGPMTTFAKLTADQQGVITRLIEARQLEENNKNVQWILECVRRYTQAESTWRRTNIVLKKLLIILKRQDRNISKSGHKLTVAGRPTSYQNTEIIDLNEPTQKVKGQHKIDKQKYGSLDHDDIMTMPVGELPDPFASPGMGGDLPIPPPPPPRQDHHRQDFGPLPAPPPGSVPIPLDHWQPQPQPQPQPPPRYNHHYSHQDQPQHMHHHGPAQFDGHPFQPMPPFNVPGAFEVPPDFEPPRRDSQYQTRNHTPDHRRSRSREAKRDSRVERKVDNLGDRLEQVIDKVDQWNFRDDRSSSEDSYRGHDYWSARPESTPPSSPPLSPREPNGTLGKKSYYHDSAYPRQQHRRNNNDAMIEPHSSRNRDRRMSFTEDRRRRESFSGNSRRPRAIEYSREPRDGRPVLRENTFNDYPNAPVAERVRQRTLPQYPTEDYDFADYGPGRERGGLQSERGRSRRDSAWASEGGKYYFDRRERVGGARRQPKYF